MRTRRALVLGSARLRPRGALEENAECDRSCRRQPRASHVAAPASLGERMSVVVEQRDLGQ